MNSDLQFVQTWLQNPDNQAKARQAGLNVDQFLPQQQSQSPMGGADPYAQYLQKMITGNEGNPELQNSLYSQYLDYTNPMAQQQAQQEDMDRKYQIASDMASSDILDVQNAGKKMLAEMFPQYLGGGETDSYFRQRRNAYSDTLKNLGKLGNARPEELQLNQILSQAPDNVIQSYEAPITWEDRIGAYGRGEDIFAKIANMFQGNEIKQERLRALGY